MKNLFIILIAVLFFSCQPAQEEFNPSDIEDMEYWFDASNLQESEFTYVEIRDLAGALYEIALFDRTLTSEEIDSLVSHYERESTKYDTNYYHNGSYFLRIIYKKELFKNESNI